MARPVNQWGTTTLTNSNFLKNKKEKVYERLVKEQKEKEEAEKRKKEAEDLEQRRRAQAAAQAAAQVAQEAQEAAERPLKLAEIDYQNSLMLPQQRK